MIGALCLQKFGNVWRCLRFAKQESLQDSLQPRRKELFKNTLGKHDEQRTNAEGGGGEGMGGDAALARVLVAWRGRVAWRPGRANIKIALPNKQIIVVSVENV